MTSEEALNLIVKIAGLRLLVRPNRFDCDSDLVRQAHDHVLDELDRMRRRLSSHIDQICEAWREPDYDEQDDLLSSGAMRPRVGARLVRMAARACWRLEPRGRRWLFRQSGYRPYGDRRRLSGDVGYPVLTALRFARDPRRNRRRVPHSFHGENRLLQAEAADAGVAKGEHLGLRSRRRDSILTASREGGCGRPPVFHFSQRRSAAARQKGKSGIAPAEISHIHAATPLSPISSSSRSRNAASASSGTRYIAVDCPLSRVSTRLAIGWLAGKL